jgi:hypothetical protein
MALAPPAVVLGLHTAALLACPDCPVGREARSLVFSEAFWVNAWYALLPFLVVALAVRWFVRRLDQGARDEGIRSE